jgi:hypothetical protein
LVLYCILLVPSRRRHPGDSHLRAGCPLPDRPVLEYATEPPGYLVCSPRLVVRLTGWRRPVNRRDVFYPSRPLHAAAVETSESRFDYTQTSGPCLLAPRPQCSDAGVAPLHLSPRCPSRCVASPIHLYLGGHRSDGPRPWTDLAGRYPDWCYTEIDVVAEAADANDFAAVFDDL